MAVWDGAINSRYELNLIAHAEIYNRLLLKRDFYRHKGPRKSIDVLGYSEDILCSGYVTWFRSISTPLDRKLNGCLATD